jgi:DNA polymerase-3 subunit delta
MADTLSRYKRLRTAFEHQNFKPVYFFYGEEQFLISELQSLLIEQALEPHEHDFNLDLVYGTETDAHEVLSLCAGYPAMAQRRVVIVREFQQLEDNRRFKEYAENPNPSAIVLLVCSDKPNLSAHPYRALKEHAEAVEFEALYDRQIPGWIKNRVRAAGYDIEAAAVEMLAQLIGSDLHKAAAEVDKLTTYVGDRQTITRDDVLHVGGHAREYNVFELQETIGEGNYPRALEIADQMLQQATRPRGEALMIVAVLMRYFRKLLKLLGCQGKNMSDEAMARHIGVPPYFFKQYHLSLNRYDRQTIERAFSALLAADYELKGGATRETRTIISLMLGQIVPDRAAAGHRHGN